MANQKGKSLAEIIQHEIETSYPENVTVHYNTYNLDILDENYDELITGLTILCKTVTYEDGDINTKVVKISILGQNETILYEDNQIRIPLPDHGKDILMGIANAFDDIEFKKDVALL